MAVVATPNPVPSTPSPVVTNMYVEPRPLVEPVSLATVGTTPVVGGTGTGDYELSYPIAG